MRYFFRRRVPEYSRVLLVESGSRHLTEAFLPRFYAEQPQARLDLVTCYLGHPSAFLPERGVIHRVTSHKGSTARRAFVRGLAAERHTIAVIVCSGEPIMARWKYLLGLLLPAKILILNENGDWFWFDYTNWRLIRHFLLFRAGVSGAGAAATLGRLAVFPFTLAYLLAYTAFIHLRRKVHT